MGGADGRVLRWSNAHAEQKHGHALQNHEHALLGHAVRTYGPANLFVLALCVKQFTDLVSKKTRLMM